MMRSDTYVRYNSCIFGCIRHITKYYTYSESFIIAVLVWLRRT